MILLYGAGRVPGGGEIPMSAANRQAADVFPDSRDPYVHRENKYCGTYMPDIKMSGKKVRRKDQWITAIILLTHVSFRCHRDSSYNHAEYFHIS